MYEGYGFIQNKVPAVTADYWKKPVEELGQILQYYNEASADLRQSVWPECARAYMCRRDLPEAEAMEFLDKSDLGETDIWDGINFLTDAIMSAQMPRDQSYLELLAYDSEDQGTLNDIRDLLMSIFRRADVRGQYARHVKQTLIYGTSVIWWQWQKIFRYKRFGQAETYRRLIEQGVEPDLTTFDKDYKNFKFPEPSFNGPIVRPVDMYDFWMDPSADLNSGNDYPVIVRYYMTITDLENAIDNDGNKKYSNLEGLVPGNLDSIYSKDPERLEISKDLGLNPLASGNKSVQLVPVYMFHAPVRTFDSDKSNKFVDMFFYVAESADKSGYRLIRVEENPNKSGTRGLYVDTYIDWISGAYGIGAVEKSVNAWQYKNVISALGLNAQVASIFPAYSVIAGALPDDSLLKLSPGCLNVINNKPGVGLNFIAPLPVPKDTVQLGQGVEQWHGQKILGQMGAYGAIMQDPTKSIKTAKTATQINTESTSGSVIRDNYLEKMVIRSLEPLMQDIYDAMRDYLDDPTITFEKTVNGNATLGSVDRNVVDKERKIVVTGYHGLINKAKEIEELQQALQVLTTGNALEQLPQLLPVLQELIFKLLGRLGVKNLDQYKQDPVQLLLQNPQIVQQFTQALAEMQGGGMPMQPGAGAMPQEVMPQDAPAQELPPAA
ncbi:MAG: hypothetical protein JSS82_15560 [Bacteroidetes bacterium]|nr:hypothetical protein [Bacteroidota bacterium]